MTAAKRLTSREAIEDYGEQLFATLPPASPQALRRSADLLSAALMQQDTGTEEREPAA